MIAVRDYIFRVTQIGKGVLITDGFCFYLASITIRCFFLSSSFLQDFHDLLSLNLALWEVELAVLALSSQCHGLQVTGRQGVLREVRGGAGLL